MHIERLQDSGNGVDQLALGLGWFSIALGIAELAAPRPLARLVGAPDTEETSKIFRSLGAREIAYGLAILSEPDRPRWLWARAAGDAMDLSLLGAAYTSNERDRPRLCAASTVVAGIAAIDLFCALALKRRTAGSDRANRSVHVEEVVTINRSIEEVYGFWRQLENLPRFMRHLASVQRIDERRSRWRATAPAGRTVEWEAEILEDRPNERIAWRSMPGAGVENSGSVTFRRAPGARGTELRVTLQYQPPAGGLGRSIAWLFGEEPAQQVREDLRRFKQIMETGEIATSDGPGLRRAARPPADADVARVPAGATR